jgi:hypothetical protein
MEAENSYALVEIYKRERNQGSARIVLVTIQDNVASSLLDQTPSLTARRVGDTNRNYVPMTRCS